MADNTTPSDIPTDLPTDPTDIENLGNKANTTTQSLNNMLQALKPLYDMLSKTFGKDRVNDVEKYTSTLGVMSNRFSDLRQKIDGLSQDLSFTVDFNGLDPVEAIDRWTKRFTEFNQFISNARIFDKFAADSGSLLNDVSSNIESLQAGLRRLGINVNLDRALIQNASQAEKLESGFIGLAAATGSLNDLFVNEGTTLKDLSVLTAAYTSRISDVADATGFSVSQTVDFARALGQVPDAMDRTVQVGDRVDDQLNSLQVAMRLMSGSGRSQKEVIDILNTAYEKLSTAQGVVSNSAQTGSEMFALISNTSNVLKLRFDDVRGVMESVADQFKFVGNETDAAAKILARYTDALRETGLTSKQSISIIQDMVGQMSKLEMGTKAFLSLRSGGPGGLQGAFQIEQLLRQGRLDQVVRMMEQTFRQQAGGRIFTQAEAAQSQEGAAGFMRQRQLLQSGVFGIGRGFTDDQATRFLEALGRRGLGGGADAARMLADSIKPGQDALQQVNDRGVAVQERSWNELKRLNNSAERSAVAAELQAGITIRNLAGATGGRGLNLQGGMRQATERAQRGVLSEMDNLQGLGATNQQEQIRQLVIMGRRAIQEGLDAGKEGLNTLGDAGAQFASAVASGINDLPSLIGDEMEPDNRAVAPPTQQFRQQLREDIARNAGVQQTQPQKITLEIQMPEGVKAVVRDKPNNIDVNPIQSFNRANSNLGPGF